MLNSFALNAFKATILFLVFSTSAFGDSITFYEDEYFQGHSFRVEGAGEISNLRTKDLHSTDNYNDEISSISISGNYSVTLYEDINFNGQSVTINLSRPYLTYLTPNYFWNDRVSSIKWTLLSPTEDPMVIFYDQPNYRGNSFYIKGDGSVYRLSEKRRGSSSKDWNDQIRSVKIYGKNTLVVLYRDAKYKGSSISLTKQNSLLKGFSATASSVKVYD